VENQVSLGGDLGGLGLKENLFGAKLSEQVLCVLCSLLFTFHFILLFIAF
jgi:preprotein translocase subunit SecG